MTKDDLEKLLIDKPAETKAREVAAVVERKALP